MQLETFRKQLISTENSLIKCLKWVPSDVLFYTNILKTIIFAFLLVQGQSKWTKHSLRLWKRSFHLQKYRTEREKE